MITGITYHEVKFNNNRCLFETIEKAAHHRSRAMNKLN